MDQYADLKDAPPLAQNGDAKEHLRLWLRLLKTSRRIEAVLRDRLRTEFDTTLPRFDVLAALARFEDGLKMSALSEVLRVSNGNVTGIVDRLVEDGLVARVKVPGDRRASLVHLTDAGKTEFARQATAHEAWIAELLGEISPEDAAHLSAQLDALSAPEAP
ncbi:Transcriptional activatory protein BadR (plasmid) [Roseivivax sp. THAF40]|uniref:MarR family winged helix-turn-helix transcriptional regulator n=1 Tax=unclassified Roseivivax TaxID=2639302 RepID=UPI0012688272|nr:MULTISPECIES: MarR family transcriptional regulator [unclassified Roseivivax]QFS84962.1 Transcriptional activatory protein BadR [Roseivivax sp. THAF197b]QFT48663.1 Transcriptional activatory protein BadR [Roseivivax sp. THAF40]